MNLFFILGASAVLFLSVVGFILFRSRSSNIGEKALSLASMGKYLDAKALIRNKLDLHPDDISLQLLMSKIYSMEGDTDTEVSYLEKILKINNFTKEITKAMILNRLAAILYQKDKYDESFFYYMDVLEEDPSNLEAIVRLGFMALGQREFEIAEKIFKQIPEDQVRFPAFFIGKGVISTILNRSDEHQYFEKAYKLDSKSSINVFLYGMSLYRQKKFQDALKIANELLDKLKDDRIRFTLYQFLIVVYMGLSDYSSALLNAKHCMEIAEENEWIEDYAESNFYIGIFCIASGEIEKANEYLIAAESEKVHDQDIINLANYRSDLEENLAIPGSTSSRGFNFKSFMTFLPDRIFPAERIYEISGLKMPAHINIKSIVNSEGIKIIKQIDKITPDMAMRFAMIRGMTFKNVCNKLTAEMNFKVKRELPCLESEGANVVAVNKDDESLVALFRFRKWKNSNLSDVFLTEMTNSMIEQGAQIGFIFAFCDLTVGAKRFLKNNEGKITVINGKEFENYLSKVIKQ
ncbi:MAG: restriction endonuclease [Leptospiraceae bacterium]|nr:restriction endonuclease [Leptospiraceae bacterium]MCP5512846.1 restriction endonuclease [Leptospiraceae bacterium]